MKKLIGVTALLVIAGIVVSIRETVRDMQELDDEMEARLNTDENQTSVYDHLA